MMKKILKLALHAGLLASLVTAASANAALVTALSGTALTLPDLNYYGTGPETVSSNITWTSTSPIDVYGLTDYFGLGENGTWEGGSPFVGSNDPSSTMTFTFATAVQGFGGLFNYASPGTGATISTYNASGVLLDSYTLNISTPGGLNAGEFFGFLDASADISAFTMSGYYIVGTDFVVQDAPSDVPEPASLALLGLGLAGVAAARRRVGSSRRLG